MRKLVYHAAISIDGFMARTDHSFDCFAMTGPHVEDFVASLGDYDVAIMGRRTYEVGLKLGVTNPYPHLKTFVFSRTMEQSPHENVKLLADRIGETVRALKSEPGKSIWLVGAGDLASDLFAEKLIDEVILKVNPILLAEGVPLVKHLAGHLELELIAAKTYDNGVILQSYKVKYQA